MKTNLNLSLLQAIYMYSKTKADVALILLNTDDYWDAIQLS